MRSQWVSRRKSVNVPFSASLTRRSRNCHSRQVQIIACRNGMLPSPSRTTMMTPTRMSRGATYIPLASTARNRPVASRMGIPAMTRYSRLRRSWRRAILAVSMPLAATASAQDNPGCRRCRAISFLATRIRCSCFAKDGMILFLV